MKTLFPLLLVLFVFSCTDNKKIPDVSGIKVELTVQRFEKDFFSMDTTHLDAALEKLNRQYPGFTKDFLYRIMGANPHPDSTMKDVRLFISSYKSLEDSAEKIFADLTIIENEVKQGLKFVKYYFPKYKLPQKLISFIGPVDAVFKTANGSSGDIITQDGLGIALQLHMGKDFSLYKTNAAQEMYPLYVSRRFEPAYIPVNCMKNIIDDLYPDRSTGRPLIEEMIEAGKRLYLLDILLPDIADTLKTGYTAKQLDGCFKNESAIWSFFVQNDLLYTTDTNLTGNYMNDGPNTSELGDASPGFIGQFVGWQIVKKWLSKKNEKINPEELMKTPAKQIFNDAKYKP